MSWVFFYKFGSTKKQKHLEAEAVNLRVLMDCSNQQKFENVKGSKIVKCVQKKYFNYIIDKCFKSFGYPVLVFIIIFVIIFINSIYQLCIPSWNFSKWAISRLYCIIISKFGVSMVSIKQMVWEAINIFWYGSKYTPEVVQDSKIN